MQEKICQKECHSRSFFQRRVLPFQVPVYICRGKPLWVYLESDRYLRICFKPRAYVRWNFDHHVLKETTLRACMYLYFTFQYTCVGVFFRGCLWEYWWVSILLDVFLQTYLLLFVFSVSFSLGEATLRTFFLVALLCFLTCRHLSCFYYFPLRQRWLVEMLVVRSFLFRWYLFFLAHS